MWKSTVAVIALTASSLVVPTTAQAADDLCGWNGQVRPLIAKADRDFRKLNIPKLAEQYYGKGMKVTDYKMMEVDLEGLPGETTPLDAKTLTENQAAFNISLVSPRGTQRGMSVLITYNGLCKTGVITSIEAWSGSTGVDKRLRIGSFQALRLAEQYRQDHADDFPPDLPLVGMNLMQATTAASDFGRLRWYVNYFDGNDGVQILTVYMDGTVKPR